MLVEALASLPIDVTVGDTVWTIPARPARAWLLALSSDTWALDVLPGLLDEGPRALLLDRMARGVADGEELVAAAKDAVAVASGRPWWETLRLVGAADQPSGAVLGELLLAGVDFDRVTLAAWCATVYQVAVRGMDEKAHTKFVAALSLPPADESPDEHDEWDMVQW